MKKLIFLIGSVCLIPLVGCVSVSMVLDLLITTLNRL